MRITQVAPLNESVLSKSYDIELIFRLEYNHLIYANSKGGSPSAFSSNCDLGAMNRRGLNAGIIGQIAFTIFL